MGSSGITLATSSTNRPLQMTAAGGGMILIDQSSGILTVPGLISGTEQMTVIGPGTLVLTNASNTYAGGTTIGDSIVRVAGPGSLGTGDITLGAQIGTSSYAGGTLRFDGGGTVAANIKHSFSSTIDTNGNNVTVSGVISGNGGELTKAGAGTLTLSGANTYIGNTKITGGTLLVNNSSGTGTGYGTVTVKTGATLGGSGTIAGAVTVESGGSLTAGATGVGKLTLFGNTSLASGSNFLVGLAGTTEGTQFGQFVVKPGATMTLGGSTFTPTLSYLPSNGDKLFIINNQNSSGGLSGTFNGLAEGAVITFGDGTTAQISYLGDYDSLTIGTGNDLVIYNFVPVPEPGSVLAVAMLSLAGLAWFSRRKGAGVAV
jgi:autotransporter-associated beta strand protein